MTPDTADLDVLRQIERRVLWLATRIIDHANRRAETSVKVGGHQASSASMASIMTALWFGHIGDGNVHLNILKPNDLSKDQFLARCQQVNQWIFEVVERYQGSVSAEHGVGLVKKQYLGYSRSEEEITLMRQVKQLFDPNNVMNPGKIFN